jgi:hypothetical protein
MTDIDKFLELANSIRTNDKDSAKKREECMDLIENSPVLSMVFDTNTSIFEFKRKFKVKSPPRSPSDYSVYSVMVKVARGFIHLEWMDFFEDAVLAELTEMNDRALRDSSDVYTLFRHLKEFRKEI